MSSWIWSPRGTDEVDMTAANAGATPAFNTLLKATGVTVKFDTGQNLFGPSCCRIHPGTSGSTEFQWTGLPSTFLSKGYARWYMRMSAWPTAANRFMFGFSVGTGGGTSGLGFDLGTDGKLTLKAINASVGAAFGPIPVNQWVRMECGYDTTSTACKPFANLFLDPNGDTPDYSVISASNVSIGSINAFRTPCRTNVSTWNFDLWLDELEVNDVAMPAKISTFDPNSLYPFLHAGG